MCVPGPTDTVSKSYRTSEAQQGRLVRIEMYPYKPSPSQPQHDKDSGRVAAELSDEQALPILQQSKIVGGQQVPWGSNYTFLVHLDAGPGRFIPAVYKPQKGEQPLYDFPSGTLYKREYAAYLLSSALGWPDVPLTVVRDGPYGVGSMQLYVEHDPQATYFELVKEHADELLPFAVFDVLANNADRKAGHCLLGNDGRIWSIDHGLTFHHIFKLRTVMLEFWGVPIPQRLLDDMKSLVARIESKSGSTAALSEMVAEREMDALLSRVEIMLQDPVIPKLDPRFNVPWPLV